MKLRCTLLLLALVAAPVLADVSYDDFDARGLSRSRHISEESQLTKSLNLLAQEMRHQNLRQIVMIACPQFGEGNCRFLGLVLSSYLCRCNGLRRSANAYHGKWRLAAAIPRRSTGYGPTVSR
jgi:hypothetical protein